MKFLSVEADTRLTLVIALIALGTQGAQAQENAVNRARLAFSAFSCGTWAEMMGDTEEQKRLFDLGYKMGKAFLDDVIANTAPEQELRDAPIGVTWMLAGPTADFILGRIFENANRDAYDSVVKEDAAGVPFQDTTKWITDEHVQQMIAQTKYQQSNCVLVRGR